MWHDRPVPGEFQGHVQRLHELIDLDWLGEIAEEPRLRPFSMSRGMALALRATTGMCAVAGSSLRILRASMPLIPGRLMSIRITSGWLARASWIPRFPSLALSRRISGRRSTSCSINIRLAGLSST